MRDGLSSQVEQSNLRCSLECDQDPTVVVRKLQLSSRGSSIVVVYGFEGVSSSLDGGAHKSQLICEKYSTNSMERHELRGSCKKQAFMVQPSTTPYTLHPPQQNPSAPTASSPC